MKTAHRGDSQHQSARSWGLRRLPARLSPEYLALVERVGAPLLRKSGDHARPRPEVAGALGERRAGRTGEASAAEIRTPPGSTDICTSDAESANITALLVSSVTTTAASSTNSPSAPHVRKASITK